MEAESHGAGTRSGAHRVGARARRSRAQYRWGSHASSRTGRDPARICRSSGVEAKRDSGLVHGASSRRPGQGGRKGVRPSSWRPVPSRRPGTPIGPKVPGRTGGRRTTAATRVARPRPARRAAWPSRRWSAASRSGATDQESQESMWGASARRGWVEYSTAVKPSLDSGSGSDETGRRSGPRPNNPDGCPVPHAG